ncbi:hypothetical protein N658DRAFT_116827 [Parathielavia hyrcaniae]|uniref:Uncharacterized protein n=1 Tax=Parathielavia hyrcaniae TaxID=113614 RepID=A0AAN6T4Z1_9PEZI|nr:hypothetical protein N658DRAFT_116827 [Parathielavia hyrcaniae]
MPAATCNRPEPRYVAIGPGCDAQWHGTGRRGRTSGVLDRGVRFRTTGSLQDRPVSLLEQELKHVKVHCCREAWGSLSPRSQSIRLYRHQFVRGTPRRTAGRDTIDSHCPIAEGSTTPASTRLSMACATAQAAACGRPGVGANQGRLAHCWPRARQNDYSLERSVRRCKSGHDQSRVTIQRVLSAAHHYAH